MNLKSERMYYKSRNTDDSEYLHTYEGRNVKQKSCKTAIICDRVSHDSQDKHKKNHQAREKNLFTAD